MATAIINPTPEPTPLPTPAPTPAPGGMIGPVNANVNDWYRNVGNRDADEAGGQYWTDKIATMGEAGAYSEFIKGMQTNEGAYAKPLALDQANADWTGTQSTAGNSNVDEWAQNVFGRPATAEEIARYGGNTTTTDAQADYATFVAAGTAAGGTANQMDMNAASRFAAPRTTQGVVSQGPVDYGSLSQEYAPVLQRGVNFDQETIEGRLGNMLKTDDKGNYTHPNIRQAVDRALQAYAGRGMLNSSMAVQAAQEAAIAKAIEIAGPDAKTYFEQARANQDASNQFARDETQQGYTERNNVNQWEQDRSMQERRIASDEYQTNRRIASTEWLQRDEQGFRNTQTENERAFTSRTNYQEMTDRGNERYSRAVATINGSNMTPADKSVAIAQAAGARDGELVYVNNLFAAQPGFKSQWLALAVSTGAMSIDTITSIDTLSNIVNDPAQPQSVRTQAQTRLAYLQANPESTPAPTPAPGAGGGGSGFNGSGD